MLLDDTATRLKIEKGKFKLNNQDKNMKIVLKWFGELTDKKNMQLPRKRTGYKPKGKKA